MGLLKICAMYALRDLNNHKVRAFLTILGIMVGIATMVELTMVGSSMEAKVEMELTELVGSAIVVRDPNGEPIPIYAAQVLSGIPGTTSVMPLVIDYCTINGRFGVILGVQADKVEEYATIIEGRNIKNDDEGVMDIDSGKRLGVGLGDEVEITSQASPVAQRIKIVGFVEQGAMTRGFVAGGAPVCVVTIAKAQNILEMRGYVNTLLVKVGDVEHVRIVEEYIRRVYPFVEIITQEDLLKSVNKILGTIRGILLALGAISLVVAGLGTMNTVMMVIREKTREIGIIKAIGGERRHVIAIFLTETLIIGIAGGGIGIAAGYWIGRYLLREFIPKLMGIELPIVFSADIAMQGMAIAIGVTIVASIVPLWRGANIRPIEALRYE